MAARDRIIFALDVGDLDSARKWVEKIGSHVGWFKVGLELFSAAGPAVVDMITSSGLKCFLDLKFHDIPNTVAGAVRSAVRLKAHMMTIHISGGREMIRAALAAAREESESLNIPKPRIIGVSVLTSLGRDDLPGLGIARPLQEQVSGLVESPAGNASTGRMLACRPSLCPAQGPGAGRDHHPGHQAGVVGKRRSEADRNPGERHKGRGGSHGYRQAHQPGQGPCPGHRDDRSGDRVGPPLILVLSCPCSPHRIQPAMHTGPG